MTIETKMTMAYPTELNPELNDKLDTLGDCINELLTKQNIYERGDWREVYRLGKRFMTFNVNDKPVWESPVDKIMDFPINEILLK